MKKITWITSENFIDVDLPILSYLSKYYDINWFIVESASNNISYRKLIKEKLKNSEIKINFYLLKYRIRNLKIIIDYYKLFTIIKKQVSEIYYLDFVGFPYFYFLFHRFFDKKKTIIAIHNVTTPIGASNYNFAKLYTDFILANFYNIQVFSISQYKALTKKYSKKNVLCTPLALKDFGKTCMKPKNEITFLNFGSIRKYKRIDVLIEAAQTAYEETNIPFKVKIAGHCNDWNKYQSLIKYDELFELIIERIPNENIPDLFSTSHYFVCPYQDIAQSGALTVALNYGLPVIASKLEAFEEIIEDGKTGYLFKTANVVELKKIMISILRNHNEIYKNLKTNQAKYIEKNYSNKRIAKKYIDYFNRVIK